MGIVDVKCNRCGDSEATWLVTMRYSSTSRAGRLVAYCDRCRGDAGEQAHVAIPYPILRSAPDLVLSTLYEQQLTDSEPRTAADVIGAAPADWTILAERLLRERRVQ